MAATSVWCYYGALVRVITVFVIGAILGSVLTFATVQISGGWYTYTIVPIKECQDAEGYGLGRLRDEVVPNQPNPCHFRRPRWPLFR